MTEPPRDIRPGDDRPSSSATPGGRGSDRRWTIGVGFKFVTVFFVVTYAGPLVANLLLGDRIEPVTKVLPLTAGAVAILAGTYLLFAAISLADLRFLPSFRLRWITGNFRRVAGWYRQRRLAIAVAVLGLAVLFALAGLGGFRYRSQSLSEMSTRLLLLWMGGTVVKFAVMADFLYEIFIDRHVKTPFLSRRYVENLLLAGAMVLFVNGTASMFRALLVLAYSVHPRWFRDLVFARRGWGWSGRRLRSLATSVIALPVLFLVAWFLGETVKVSTGLGGALTPSVLLTAAGNIVDGVLAGPAFLTDLGLWFIRRMSSHYYAFLFTVNRSWAALNAPSGWVLIHPVSEFLFRLDFLLGGIFGVPEPELGSLAIVNYRQITLGSISPRQGTSPGLVASFNYVFPFPLNVLLAALFMAWIAKVVTIWFDADDDETLSLIGALVLFSYTLFILQSPFDLLIAINGPVIYFAILYLMYRVRAEGRSRPRPDAGHQRGEVGT